MKKNDNSLFVAYEKNLQQFKDSVVKAGILAKDGSENHSDGITVFQIGMIHEFGVPEKNIPRRSFIRVPIENNIKEITKLIENNHRLVSENAMSAKVALDRIGIKAQNTIKESFRNNDWKPNAPITVKGGWMSKNGKKFFVKGKGSSRPLIDKGQLIGSISYIVEKEN